MTHPDRASSREDLLRLIERLIAEFAGFVPAGSVIRCVSRTRQELLQAGVRVDLLACLEQVSRARLADRIPAHGAA